MHNIKSQPQKFSALSLSWQQNDNERGKRGRRGTQQGRKEGSAAQN